MTAEATQENPRSVDSLVFARWVVPVAPDSGVLEDHAVVVDQGRIVEVSPAAEARQRFRARTERHLDDHALIPGLVNAHTHAAMTLLRGYADDLPLMVWLQERIWPAEQAWVSPEFVRDGTRLAVAEMIRGGTTTFADMYFFPDQVAAVAEACGIRLSLGLVVIQVPTAWAKDEEEYLARAVEMHEALADRPLVTTTLSPHAPYTVSTGGLEKVAELAERLDVQVPIHVHETQGEVDDHLRQFGVRPLRRLADAGLVNERLVAVHMVWLEDAEIEQMAEAGGHVVHCPESNLKLASGCAPVAALAAAGVNVALGTDGAASNNDLDMFGELRTAALLGKWVGRNAGVLPAQDVLRMATLDGARALGLDRRIGSLEVGKEADMVAVKLTGVETEPLYDPVSQLVYATGRDRVTHVWVAGRMLLDDRALTTIDQPALLSDVREWRGRLSAGR